MNSVGSSAISLLLLLWPSAPASALIVPASYRDAEGGKWGAFVSIGLSKTGSEISSDTHTATQQIQFSRAGLCCSKEIYQNLVRRSPPTPYGGPILYLSVRTEFFCRSLLRGAKLLKSGRAEVIHGPVGVFVGAAGRLVCPVIRFVLKFFDSASPIEGIYGSAIRQSGSVMSIVSAVDLI